MKTVGCSAAPAIYRRWSAPTKPSSRPDSWSSSIGVGCWPLERPRSPRYATSNARPVTCPGRANRVRLQPAHIARFASPRIGPPARCSPAPTPSWPRKGSAPKAPSSARTPGRAPPSATTPGSSTGRGVLTNPNMFLAGQIGRGKSTLAKALATRYIAFGRRVYVPGDPKGEWSVVTRAVGGQVIELGIGRPARLNPLDEGPRPAGLHRPRLASSAVPTTHEPARRAAQSTLGRPLHPTERTALDAALDAACRSVQAPVLPMVVDAPARPRRRIRRLQHRPAHRRRQRSRPRPRPARARRPRRPFRRALHRRLRPVTRHALPGPIPHCRLRPTPRTGHGLHIGVDGSLARRPAPVVSVWSSTTKPGGCSPIPLCSPACKPTGNSPAPGGSPT